MTKKTDLPICVSNAGNEVLVVSLFSNSSEKRLLVTALITVRPVDHPKHRSSKGGYTTNRGMNSIA